MTESDSSYTSHRWCRLSHCNMLQSPPTILAALPNVPLYGEINANSKVIIYPFRGNKDWIQAYLLSLILSSFS